MTLRDWADSTVLATTRLNWPVGHLPVDENWQEWGLAFVRAGATAGQTVPYPYTFTDWRKWAERVYPMLEATV